MFLLPLSELGIPRRGWVQIWQLYCQLRRPPLTTIFVDKNEIQNKMKWPLFKSKFFFDHNIQTDSYHFLHLYCFIRKVTDALISYCYNPKRIGKCCKDGSRKLLLSTDLLSMIVKHSNQGVVTGTCYFTKHFSNQNDVLNRSFCDPGKKVLDLKLRQEECAFCRK